MDQQLRPLLKCPMHWCSTVRSTASEFLAALMTGSSLLLWERRPEKLLSQCLLQVRLIRPFFFFFVFIFLDAVVNATVPKASSSRSANTKELSPSADIHLMSVLALLSHQAQSTALTMVRFHP